MKRYSFFAIALFVLLGCNQKSDKSSDASQFAKYILTQNINIISQQDDVFIKFRTLPFDKDKITKSVKDGVINLKPKAKGVWKWTDNQTLKFYKDESLNYNTRYTVSVDLSQIFEDVDLKNKNYRYNFDTEDLYFKSKRISFQSQSTSNSDMLNVKVDLSTNVPLDEKNVLDYLKLTAENEEAPLLSFKKESTRDYVLTYGPVQKGEKSKKILFSHNIIAQNENSKGSKSKSLPSISEFTFLDAIVSENNSSFSITFSDPLKKQDYNGLVRVKDYSGTYKYSATNNKLLVYLDKGLEGNKVVTISNKIVSSDDKKMTSDAEFSLTFKTALPEVRAVVEGNIIPYNDKVIFPFEAISLDTVEVQVYKIFENNVLDYLKNMDLNSNNKNEFLGRVVHTEKVSLGDLNKSENGTEWQRYALDLKKMTELDPGAIYQIVIGYKRSYVSYPCTNAEETRVRSSAFDFNNYYRYYDYGKENDPCSHSYYEYHKFIVRNLLASNIGLIAKKGKEDRVHVYSSDLRTGEPMGGVTIQLFDKQKQGLGETVTNAKGMADVTTDRNVAFVIAKKTKDYAYLNLFNSRSNSLADFDVSGANLQKGLNGYIYGERGVWRPGDTLHLSFMVFDKTNDLDENHPARMIVKDSKGQQKYDQTLTENENGLYVFHIPTSQDDATGLWTAQANFGNFKTSKRIKVETIKPNRIKVDLDFTSKELDASKKENFDINAQWLHGAPASDLKTEIDIQYKVIPTQFDEYKSFAFQDPSREVKATMAKLFQGKLSADGTQKVSIDFGKSFTPPGKLRAQLRTRVYEKSGNFSEDYTGVDVNPYSHYAGIYIPESRWKDRVLNVEEDEKIKFVSVDKSGNPKANRKLSVGIYEARWRWWYNRTDRNIFRHNSAKHLGSIDKKELVTNSKGEVDYLPVLNGHGTYLVRVCDTESGHCSGQLFYTSRWGRNNNEQEQIAKLDFSLDKESYKPGESVELSVPTNSSARLLVSIENNKEVMQSFWVDCSSDLTKIDIPVFEDMTPNVYVHVTLVQGTDKSNDLPIRLYGVMPFKVVDEKTVLNPVIEMADEIRPNASTTIKIKEKTGKAMSYTLAVVDEGLLDITNFKTPQPWNHFYKKQSLGVRSWDMYDFVLNKYGGEIEKIITIGGDGEVGEESKNLSANRFKPVVTFLGPFTIDKNGGKTHKIDVPNYVGALRVMVVAKNDIGFGKADKNVFVKDPLMVKTTLPRVLAPGESLRLPVNVFAYEDDIKTANIKLEHTNNLVSASKTGQLNFEKQGDKLYSFDLSVGDAIGIAKIGVDVNSNAYSAKEEIEIEIRNPSPEQTEAYTKVINKGESFNLDFENIGMQGTNNAYVELSMFPDFNLNDRLNYLIRYPYGCVEQTTSSVFPQLYLSEIMELDDEEKVTRNVEAAIRRLISFQRPSGGLSYWPGNGNANNWGTSYAGHFLLEARNKGYFVSEPFIKNWTKYQKSESKRYQNSKYRYEQRDQAYRLYTLALAGDPELSSMNNLRLEKGLHKTNKFILAAAYALIGQQDVVEDLLNSITYDIEDYTELGNTYGSGLRDRAMLLMTLDLIEKKEDAYKVALDIAESLSSKRWYSTQTTAFSLMSITKFLAKQEKGALSYTLKMDDTFNTTHTSEESIDFYKLDVDKQSSHKVSLVNNGDATLHMRLITAGRPEPNPSASFDRGLTLGVRYQTQEGKSLDPKSLKLGTDFKAVVTVKNISNNSTNYEELALNHTLPSGWEIQNLRLADIDTKESSRYEYQDVRDDRVYTFFDLGAGATKTFVINLTAAYAGTFFMPNVSCEAMYDKEISASEEGAWVKVKP